MKKTTLLMLAMAAMMTASVQAGELKIGENDSQSSYAPIYVTWADKYYCSQILYPASELSALSGQQIDKLAFFLRATISSGSYDYVQIRFKEVNFDEFEEAAYVAIDDATLVYEGSLPASESTTLEVDLIAPYIYQGGTLLVDVRKTQEGGSYAPSSGNKGRFQSTSCTTYTVLYNYGSSSFPTSASRSANRPDIKFTYSEGVAPACDKIETLVASVITASEATLTWTSDADQFEFVCVRKGEEADWTGVTAQAVKSVSLDTLKANTDYDFYVRSWCADDAKGNIKKVGFKTDLSCYAPTMIDIPDATVTSNSAIVTWHASGKGETTYQYTYGIYGSSPDWEKAEKTTDLQVQLTGLNAASMYQFFVRSYCSDEDQSDFIEGYFATACGAVALPFVENFDSGIDCWTEKNLASYSGVTTLGEFAFAWAATPPYQAIITPEIIASAKEVQVSFQYKAHNSYYPESFKVGYSTTTNDIENAFTWSDEVSLTQTTYQDYADILPAGVKYVAIQCWSNNQYYLYIDNFSVEEYEAPACPVPTGLKVNDVDANSAEIEWTSEATAWYYQTSQDGLAWSDAAAAATNPFELTGLNANTLYYVRVQANCGEEKLSDWTDAVSFRTECGAMAVPYNDGFEDAEANELPNCWARISVDGSPVVYEDSYYDQRARTGSKSLKFYGYEIDQIGILPEFEKELSELSAIFFYTHSDDAESPEAKVGYITDPSDAATFEEVLTLPAATEYTRAQVDFSAAPAGARIAFRLVGGTWFGSLYIDDLEVLETKDVPSAVENTSVKNEATKRIVNGQLIIEHNGSRYNALGSEVK